MGVPVTPHLCIVLSALPISAILLSMQKYLIVVLICVSLLADDIELSIHKTPLYHIFFGGVSVGIFLPQFSMGLFVFLLLSFKEFFVRFWIQFFI